MARFHLRAGVLILMTATQLAAATNSGYRFYVAFDGTNDYFSKTGALAGVSNTKQCVISLPFKVTSFAALSNYVFSIPGGTGSAGLFFYFTSAGRLFVDGYNTLNVLILRMTIDGFAINTAYHLLMSFDLSSAALRSAYLADTDASATWSTYTNDTLDVTGDGLTTNYLGGFQPTGGGVGLFYGQLFRPYVALSQYTDFSLEANRRKFINSSGKVVNGGYDGSGYLGTQPTMFYDGSPNDFNNRGSGGAFTLTGTLTQGDAAPV